MPAGKVKVKVTFMDDNTMLNYFVDVKAADCYYDAVLWAAQNGITSGTDAVHFSPNAPCTRSQIVTFLWRAAGSPEPKSMDSFTDVSGNSYYAKAVAWAVENGITGGTGNGKFSPNATCTREQAVAFLYRAAGSPRRQRRQRIQRCSGERLLCKRSCVGRAERDHRRYRRRPVRLRQRLYESAGRDLPLPQQPSKVKAQDCKESSSAINQNRRQYKPCAADGFLGAYFFIISRTV